WGGGATFLAPAMWPATYSERLRESSTIALPSARIRRISALLISAVLALLSPIMAWSMLVLCAVARVASTVVNSASASAAAPARIKVDFSICSSLEFVSMFGGEEWRGPGLSARERRLDGGSGRPASRWQAAAKCPEEEPFGEHCPPRLSASSRS